MAGLTLAGTSRADAPTVIRLAIEDICPEHTNLLH